MATSGQPERPYPRVGTMARALGAAYWTIMAGTAAAVILDENLRSSRNIAVCTLVLSVLALARAAVLGLGITRLDFVFRSWFRTYRLERSGISRFTIAPYAGMLNWFRDSPRYSMVVVSYRGSMIPLPYTSARKDHAIRVVEGLNRRLAEPLPS